MTETTALGAAMAAGNAEGIDVWSMDSLDQNSITSDTFSPAVSESGKWFARLLFSDSDFVFNVYDRTRLSLHAVERCRQAYSRLGNDS
jgi:glycerol kinase